MSDLREIKFFEGQKIRREWDDGMGDWWYSIIDMVAILTNSTNPRHYWTVLKGRLLDEGNETVTNCERLGMISPDGKMRLTDVANTEQILRLVQSIPSKRAEPFKVWLAKVGNEFINEAVDPELAMDRAVRNYQRLGYSENWINQRLKTIEARKALTDEWEKSGVKAGRGYAELVLNMLAEVATTDISVEEQPVSKRQSAGIAKRGAAIARNARVELEQQTGKKVISPLNAKGLGQQKIEGGKL